MVENKEPTNSVQQQPGSEAVVCFDLASMPGLEMLKGQIMAEIEAKLSLKEESLWRRGQVEIRRLQLEQGKMQGCLSKLQDRQASLVNENQKTRGALLEVTSKFELVVKEMREVLRALPDRPRTSADALSPSPSVASTSASELAREENSFERQPCDPTPPSNEPSAIWSSGERGRPLAHTPVQQQTPVVQTPVPMWHHTRGAAGGFDGECCTSGLLLTELPSFDSEELGSVGDNKTFCTPPRVTSSSGDSGQRMDMLCAPPPPPSWQGCGVGMSASASPAVLSLASALPSASISTAASAVTPNPSPGLKRLHLAEHLEQSLDVMTTSPASMPFELSSANAAGQVPISPVRQFDFFKIELAKDEGLVTLGIEVNQVDGSSLRVEGIDEHGLVGRYNLQQDSEVNKVHAGDRIIEVNGIQHDPSLMLHQCKVQQRLAVTIARDSNSCHAVNTITAAQAQQVGGHWDMSRMGGVSTACASDMVAAVAARAPLCNEEAAGVAAGVIGAEDEVVATAENNMKVGSPGATKQLRPDAQVFVPSAQKAETPGTRTASTNNLAVPPGLGGYDMGGLLSLSSGLAGASPAVGVNIASSLLATAPPQQMQHLSAQDPLTVLGLQAVCENSAFEEAGAHQQDVKRALFS